MIEGLEQAIEAIKAMRSGYMDFHPKPPTRGSVSASGESGSSGGLAVVRMPAAAGRGAHERESLARRADIRHARVAW